MKKIKRSKPTFKSAIKDVPLIKDLYDQFLGKGFTTIQAQELTVAIVKLIIK